MEISSFEEKPLAYSAADLDKAEGLNIDSLMASCQQRIADPAQWIDQQQPEYNIMLSSLESLLKWGRHNSVWPLGMGLACCAMEMIATAAPRFDISRFGMELFRASPRQADLMIVSGTLTWKMAPQVKRIYEQMAEPKWVIAMGVCAISGGTFRDSYNVVPGVNLIVPVDVYIPGCPPRPEALLHGVKLIHDKIDKSGVK